MTNSEIERLVDELFVDMRDRRGFKEPTDHAILAEWKKAWRRTIREALLRSNQVYQ